MYEERPLEVKVWGQFACYTRPENKVERVSYEVPTPSAARGTLESIFWKPQFDWVIRRIKVLKEINHFSITRNEVKTKASYPTLKRWASEDNPDNHYLVEDKRTQRHSLILKNVAYIIQADQVLRPGVDPENLAKYRAAFRRRVNKGQCFRRPFLGCREFSAFFGPPSEEDQALPINKDLGFTLFDLIFDDEVTRKGELKTKGPAVALFFQAELRQGVLEVPRVLYNQTLANKENR